MRKGKNTVLPSVVITGKVTKPFYREKSGRKRRLWKPPPAKAPRTHGSYLSKTPPPIDPKAKLPLVLSKEVNPGIIYQARSLKLASTSKPGIERFAYMIFGPTFMGSLALALNPYSKVEFPLAVITPANRTVALRCIEARSRKVRSFHRNTSCFNTPNLETTYPFDWLPVVCTTAIAQDFTLTYPGQPYIPGSRSDTTIRTRPLGSKFGEFELFAPKIDAPTRQTHWKSLIESLALAGGNTSINSSLGEVFDIGEGPGFWISKADVDVCKANEIAFSSNQMVANGLKLIDRCLPNSKKFQLAYNIAELKDLPMMLRNTVELLRHPTDVLHPKGAGNQYLNYKFGWDSTVSAIRNMLSLPTKISDHVNYLIKRRGLATNYKSKITGVYSLESTPVFNYNLHQGESLLNYGIVTRRDWELRCALNLTTHFPELEVPILRQDLLDKAWGVSPTPSDVYNLVPWTWLADWFSGIGDYVQIMDTLAFDSSTFNYGFLTYSCKGNATATLKTRTTSSWSRTTSPPSTNYTETTFSDRSFCASLSYRYQKRIDISTLKNVKTYSRSSTLGAGQLAILSALLAKFTHS